MILAGMLLALTLVLRLSPDTPLARYLHQLIVVRLVSWGGGLDRRRIIFCILAIVMITVASEMIAAAGSLDFAFIYAADLSLVLDVLVGTLAITASVRLRASWKAAQTGLLAARSVIVRRFAHRARTRQPRTRRRLPSANDDEDIDRLAA